MRPEPKLTITEFKNPAGSVSYRVSGVIDGERIRKNFPTRAEAAAEKQALEIEAMQRDFGMRRALTRLSDEQLHEAESAFQRLQGKPRPLTFYIDYAIANFREPSEQKSLESAIEDYIASKRQEAAEGHLSSVQIARIEWDLRRLLKRFPGVAMAEITTTALIGYLEDCNVGMKTFNNMRGVLSTFFKHGFLRGWINENPVLRVPHYRIRKMRGMASTFSATQAAELMAHFEEVDGGRWIPYFALCLFAGIRPGVPGGEITRIKPADVNLKEGYIYVSAEASKVREPRHIQIQPNLRKWLEAYPLDRYPIIIGDFKKRREKFKDQFNLTHDVLRHTFISMFVAKFRSIGEAAIQAGNSEAIIRRHYLNLKTQAEAEVFWSITPKRIQMPAASVDTFSPHDAHSTNQQSATAAAGR
jgi:integrase